MIQENAPIETNNLTLRAFEKSDLDDFFECCKNPNLGNNAGWKPHETKEESKTVLEEIFIGTDGIWAIVLKETNRVIGSIGIINDPKRENLHARMLGYWLKEDYWGMGLATEATTAILKYGFITLNLNIITANCYPHNTRSKLLLERNGFTCEGILHQAEETYDGHVYDYLCFYLTRALFERQNNL